MRPDRPKQFGDDGDDPFEVAGPIGAFHHVAERAGNDACLEARWVHRPGGRGEHDRHAGRSTDSDIVVDRTRVAVEVGGLVELQRIDKNRHDHEIGAARCIGNERNVAAVERAHRGYEPNGFACRALLVSPVTHVSKAGKRDHRLGR